MACFWASPTASGSRLRIFCFFNQYIATHAREAEMMQSMPLSPRPMMAIIGPVIGVISGVVIGLLALLATKVVKPAGGAASV